MGTSQCVGIHRSYFSIASRVLHNSKKTSDIVCQAPHAAIIRQHFSWAIEHLRIIVDLGLIPSSSSIHNIDFYYVLDSTYLDAKTYLLVHGTGYPFLSTIEPV